MSSASHTSAGVPESILLSEDKPSTWIISLSKPYQYAILALLALYAPSAIGNGPLFDPYLQLLLFVSIVFGSLLVSTTNLAGPIRYVYHNFKSLKKKANPLVSLVTTKATAWVPLPFILLAILPWFRTWLFMGVIPVAWQFVRENHRQAVREISDRIDEWCAKAERAANKALADAAAAEQLKQELEKNLKAADLYNKCSAAWATLDNIECSAKNSMQIPTAQGALATGAKSVANTVNSVMEQAVQAFDAAHKALGYAAKLQDQAANVKTAVEEGRMKDVAEAMETEAATAAATLTAAETESAKAATAKQQTKTHAREVYLAWQAICEEYRRVIAETTLQTDAAASKAVAAVVSARNDKAAAEEATLRALKVAAAASRDAKAGQHLRAADFFEALPKAWTELDIFEEAVNQATSTAETVFEGVKTAATPPPPAQFNMAEFQEKALDVTGAVEDLKHETQRIKNVFLTYQPAIERVEAARTAQKLYAQDVARLTDEISKASRNAANAMAQASSLAHEVEAHVAAARKAAVEGDTPKAADETKKAETKSAGVIGAADEARKAKETAEDKIQSIVMLENAN